MNDFTISSVIEAFRYSYNIDVSTISSLRSLSTIEENGNSRREFEDDGRMKGGEGTDSLECSYEFLD